MLARRFAYHAWADRECLGSLVAAGDASPPRAREILAHVLGSQRVWLGRLGQPEGEAGHAIWPDFSLEQIDAGLAALAPAWPAILARFPAEALARPVTYTNQRNETFTDTVGDIFEHLLLHAHYHRGQVALLLGRAGLKAAVTDFIVWTRQVEPRGR